MYSCLAGGNVFPISRQDLFYFPLNCDIVSYLVSAWKNGNTTQSLSPNLATCGGNVSDLVVARNCCVTRMLTAEAELVSG